MVKLWSFSLAVYLLMNAVWAQKLPRPGGGGEYHLGKVKSNINWEPLYKVFKTRLRKCYPDEKMKLNFENIYRFLQSKNLEAMLISKNDYHNFDLKCKKNQSKLDCLLNSDLRNELKHIIRQEKFITYLREENNLTPQEIKETLNFLQNIVNSEVWTH
jgi:hypothetical protein